MRLATLVLGSMLAGPAFAQAPTPPRATPQVTVDPARLAAARLVVARSQGDRDTTLQAMAAPMTAMVQQMGLREPEKAQVMVREVIMPILSARYDDLLSIQALSFAAVLSKEDLEGVAAFYDTPAGRNMAKAQPQLAQASMTGIQQWLGTLAGEMQAKIAAAAEAHGWAPKGNRPKPN